MLPDDELNQQLARFRAMLNETPELWPETADALLPFPYGEFGLPEIDLSESDDALLALVANDHQRGDDIEMRYPHLYQSLQSNPAMRDAFLETLDMLEDDDYE